MKQILVYVGIVILIVACASPQATVKIEKTDGEEMPADSVEYEMETFDTNFETWYQLQKSPARYRMQSYYESWNRQYVAAWNTRSMDRRTGFVFETIIGYEPVVDYGFELNHELFYYFQYVENVLKVKILQGGPRVVLF